MRNVIPLKIATFLDLIGPIHTKPKWGDQRTIKKEQRNYSLSLGVNGPLELRISFDIS